MRKPNYGSKLLSILIFLFLWPGVITIIIALLIFT